MAPAVQAARATTRRFCNVPQAGQSPRRGGRDESAVDNALRSEDDGEAGFRGCFGTGLPCSNLLGSG